ncbi:terminase small subunit [Clostridium sp. SYSU_GA19001]|uniref:terminase small subunit n=1 Tax=Clostridium caldaquaticum TaxID=2940653 RepID=UPI0020777A2C|nr:terminase small subunit [Clostridium caldaquaticum]
MKLTIKQKAFADYYIELGNATESYIRAGYKATTREVAEANARKLLGKNSVKNYLAERMKLLESEKIAKSEEILKYLTSAMRGEITEEVVIVEGEGEGCSSARIVRKEISAKDRTKAAELLGKRYRLFTEKIEADVNQTIIFEGENELED